MSRTSRFRFGRLTEVPAQQIIDHMSDPVTIAHMPLAGMVWTEEVCADFVATKEACWDRDGLGHWAIFEGDRYIGWGGFQREGEDWDYGLVLRPDIFGLGLPVTAQALDFARADARIPYITFLLPPSRRRLGALRRMGAEQVGQVQIEGATFLKFRLETETLPATGPATG